jgi:predicted nucleic acid-binding protein
VVVVSNTSPLVNLAAIGQADLLGVLYGEIIVPPAVQKEFATLRQREPRFASAVLPACVRVQPLSVSAALHGATLALLLDDGEAETLALAIDLRADLVLVDERAGNRIAHRLNLRPQGLIGVLIEGKATGHLPAVAPLLDRLEHEARFWLSPGIRAKALQAAGEGNL